MAERFSVIAPAAASVSCVQKAAGLDKGSCCASRSLRGSQTSYQAAGSKQALLSDDFVPLNRQQSRD